MNELDNFATVANVPNELPLHRAFASPSATFRIAYNSPDLYTGAAYYFNKIGSGSDSERSLTALLLASMTENLTNEIANFDPATVTDLTAHIQLGQLNRAMVGGANTAFTTHADWDGTTNAFIAAVGALQPLQVAKLSQRGVALFHVSCMLYIKFFQNILPDTAEDLAKRCSIYGGVGLPERHTSLIYQLLVARMTNAACLAAIGTVANLLQSEKIYRFRGLSSRGVSDLSMASKAKNTVSSVFFWRSLGYNLHVEINNIPNSPTEQQLIAQSEPLRVIFHADNFFNVNGVMNITAHLQAVAWKLADLTNDRTGRNYVRGEKAAASFPALMLLVTNAFAEYNRTTRNLARLAYSPTIAACIQDFIAIGKSASDALREYASMLAKDPNPVALQAARTEAGLVSNATLAELNRYLAQLNV